MAGPAVASLETIQSHQEYARSMSTLEWMGRVGVQGCRVDEMGYADYDDLQAEYLARTDLIAGVVEMLKTVPELRKYMEVESRYRYDVVDGKVLIADGRPVVDMVEVGYKTSKKAAETNSWMEPQVQRDKNDLLLAQKVNALEPGQSLFALSMEPKDELSGPNRELWERMGYREGIAYLQWYSKESNSSLDAGAYSIDLSDEDAWRKLFAEIGVELPEDLSPNDWLQHSFERTLDADQAQNFALELRHRYYVSQEQQYVRHSLDQFLHVHGSFITEMFEKYYKKLAHSLYTGQNNIELANFAASVLQHADDLDPVVHQQLERVATSDDFDTEMGMILDAVLKYAVAEELRENLEVALSAAAYQAKTKELTLLPLPAIYGDLNTHLAIGVHQGVEAGRDYGGCAGVTLTRNKKNGIDGLDHQDVFGGRHNLEGDEDEDDESEVCDYVHDGCYCCGYEDDGSPRPTRKKVEAHKDSDETAYCLRRGCGAWLKPNGDHEIGKIARKAQALEAEQSVSESISEESKIEA